MTSGRQQSNPVTPVIEVVPDSAAGKGKEPVEMIVCSKASRSSSPIPATMDSLQTTHPKAKSPLASESPSLSPSPRPSRLASKVRLIDGVVPKILHKGDPLPGDLSSVILVNKAVPALPFQPIAELQYPGLNAGPSEGAL